MRNVREETGAFCACCGEEMYSESMYELPNLRNVWVCYDCACEKGYDFDICNEKPGYAVREMEDEYWRSLWRY